MTREEAKKILDTADENAIRKLQGVSSEIDRLEAVSPGAPGALTASPHAIPLKKIPQLLLRILVPLLTVFLVLGFIQGFCRLFQVDFGGEKAYTAYPIYYRQPTVPVGDIFFRRPGPALWEGNVLQTGLRLAGGLENTYAQFPPVAIAYDTDGFRNPESLFDWDIVVCGDSFVELGYLPYEDLFTTKVGEALNVTVKNLGISYSGPKSYAYFLRNYGQGKKCRHAIMVFFEGNDIEDAVREEKSLKKFAAKGKRPLREIKQTSMWQAIQEGLNGSKNIQPKKFQNAFFLSPQGKTPVTASYFPPGKAQLTPDERTVLQSDLQAWGKLARDSDMTPWLAFMPANRRVFDGSLEFLETAPKELVQWQPNDLPEYIAELCQTCRLRFIDLTPALRGEVQAGRLPFNPIWDSHINRNGSALVAGELVQALRPFFPAPQSR